MKKALIIGKNRESYIDCLKQLEYEIEICNYKNLKDKIQNDYQIIQYDDSLIGFIGRFLTRKNKAKKIYVSNGFKFYKNSFFLNWVLYPIEKYLSRYTDIIITSNKEDYVLAKNNFKTQKIKYINLINYQIKSSKPTINLELKKDDYIFLNIGKLEKKENQIIQLEAMIEVIKEQPKTKLFILGKGNYKEYLEHIIEKYGLSNNVQLIENGEEDMLKLCDCLMFTTKRYGNKSNIVKAMMKNKPIIATDIREYRDILKNKNLIINKDVVQLRKRMLNYIKENKKTESYYKIENLRQENIKTKIINIYKSINY